MKPLKVNDLPEHGLLIVDQSDPSFDSRLLASLGNTLSPSIDLLKRFSVFVVNNSDHAVAALTVNWEFVQPDGRTVSRYRESRGFNLFGNDKSVALAAASGAIPMLRFRPVIEPHSSRMSSLIDTGPTGGVGTGVGVGSGVGPGSQVQLTKDRTDIPDDMRQIAEKHTALQINELNKLVEKSVSWSVSIDGVFFEDGTFVGPDKKGSFDRVKAEHNARFDLLQEILNIMAQSKDAQNEAYAEAFKYVESIEGSGNPTLSGFKGGDFYKYKKAIFAQQILSSRKKLGEQKTITLLREVSKMPHIQLIKQEDPSAPKDNPTRGRINPN